MKHLLTANFVQHLLLLSLVWLNLAPSQKEKPRPIAIRTVIEGKIEREAPPLSPVIETKKLETKQAPPSPNLLAPPKVQKKKPQEVAAPPTKGLQHHQQLHSLLQKSLKTLEGMEGTPVKVASVKKIETLKSEQLKFENGYEEALSLSLHSLLSLPEKGSVKIKLTLERDGHVQKLEILATTSEKNSAYLNTALPSCIFPPFGLQFKGEPRHTFTLTLLGD